MTAKDARYTGKTVTESRQEHLAWTWQQPSTVRCAHCTWTSTGPLEHAHTKFVEHRLSEHPDIPIRTRKRQRAFWEQAAAYQERRRAAKNAA